MKAIGKCDDRSAHAVATAALGTLRLQQRGAEKAEVQRSLVLLTLACANFARDREVAAAFYHRLRGVITSEEAARRTLVVLPKYQAAAQRALEVAARVAG